MRKEIKLLTKRFFTFFIADPMNYFAAYFKLKFLNAQTLIFSFAGWLVSYVIPVAPVLLAMFALTILDFVAGVQAAKYKIGQYEKQKKKIDDGVSIDGIEPIRPDAITWQGLYRTAQKIGVYICCILGSHVISVVYIVPFFDMNVPLIYMISLPIVMSELKSIDKNTYIVTGVSFWKFVPVFGQKIIDDFDRKKTK